MDPTRRSFSAHGVYWHSIGLLPACHMSAVRGHGPLSQTQSVRSLVFPLGALHMFIVYTDAAKLTCAMPAGADLSNAVVDRVLFDGANLKDVKFVNAVITGRAWVCRWQHQ